MKKTIPLLLLIALFLTGCAGFEMPDLASLLATPSPIVPEDTATPRPTVTLIPTRDLFATLTSTPVTFTPGVTTPQPDEGPTLTRTPRPTFSPPLNDPSNQGIFTRAEGFQGILYSGNVIYWNEGPCMPRNVRITAYVENLEETDKVLLFLRLREKKNTLNVTDWVGATMLYDEAKGVFTYNIRTFNIRKYYLFKDAWLEYQLVAITENLEVLGRTQVFERNISLTKCIPVP
jgi:hypothetical protein